MLLCPSLMCADFLNLGEEVDSLCSAGADIMHLDVMDGHYVPNYALSLGDVEAIAKRSSVPCDAHLMVTNPYDACEFFIHAGASIIYVHPESDLAINSTLLKISRRWGTPGNSREPGFKLLLRGGQPSRGGLRAAHDGKPRSLPDSVTSIT